MLERSCGTTTVHAGRHSVILFVEVLGAKLVEPAGDYDYSLADQSPGQTSIGLEPGLEV